MLASLSRANGMVFIPPGSDLPAGAEVVAWELRGRDD
jgi:molybdopterin biosynthesis enzyme